MSTTEHAMGPRPSASEQRTSTEDGEVSKSDAVIALHQTLVNAPFIASGTGDNLPVALGLYLKMLDGVDRSTERAHQRDAQTSSQTVSEACLGGSGRAVGNERDREEEVAGSDESIDESSGSEDDRSQRIKHS
ncbi:hypothetical protein V8B97DRAFT_2006402 [Scleroderma yunnanense]